MAGGANWLREPAAPGRGLVSISPRIVSRKSRDTPRSRGRSPARTGRNGRREGTGKIGPASAHGVGKTGRKRRVENPSSWRKRRHRDGPRLRDLPKNGPLRALKLSPACLRPWFGTIQPAGILVAFPAHSPLNDLCPGGLREGVRPSGHRSFRVSDSRKSNTHPEPPGPAEMGCVHTPTVFRFHPPHPRPESGRHGPQRAETDTCCASRRMNGSRALIPICC
jgi:hypothetical protein